MKVKVINIFVDKSTKERYKIGKILVVSKERYEEIKDYVEVIKKEENDKME